MAEEKGGCGLPLKEKKKIEDRESFLCFKRVSLSKTGEGRREIEKKGEAERAKGAFSFGRNGGGFAFSFEKR